MAVSLISNPSEAADAVPLPPPVAEFFQGRGLLAFTSSIADLARTCFDLAEPLTFSLHSDPESGEKCVEVVVTARGTVSRVRECYRRFTETWIVSMPAVVQEHVRLILLAE